jgi:hypothetical protein
LLQSEIINERGKGELPLIEGASANRENATGTADAADAWMMRRRGARADGRRCDQSRNDENRLIIVRPPLTSRAASIVR